MRILQFAGGGKINVTEQPAPTPGPGQVLVQTAVSALCGSELHGYRGAGRAVGNSGHEAAGTVIALGDGVTTLQVGQRVGLCAVVGCGQCAECTAGRYTWCSSYKVYSDMHAEQIVIPAHGCHPLPDNVSWQAGVLLSGDGLGVPYHTGTRLTDPALKTIAVFGVGPIGLGHTLLQSFYGRQVIAVDIATARLDYAAELGATYLADASAGDPVAQIRELTGGQGADVCIEAAGRPETLKQCFAAVRTNGTVVMNGEQPSVDLSPSQDFIRRDITAFGSWFYHYGEFPAMLALYRQGLPVEKLVTHTFSCNDADRAFAAFAAGRTGKVLLGWDSGTVRQ